MGCDLLTWSLAIFLKRSFYCGEEIVKILQNRTWLFSELTKIDLFSIGDIPSLVLIHFSAHLNFLFIMLLMKIN